MGEIRCPELEYHSVVGPLVLRSSEADCAVLPPLAKHEKERRFLPELVFVDLRARVRARIDIASVCDRWRFHARTAIR